MTNNNDTVVINLDRPRELRFGHKALKTFQAISDVKMENIGDDMDFDTIEKLVYCGLLSDARKAGETLTLEVVGDLLDDVAVQYTMGKIGDAMDKAFNDGEQKN